jgi:hypothetical protein
MPTQCPPGQANPQIVLASGGRNLSDGGTNVSYTHNTWRAAGNIGNLFLSGGAFPFNNGQSSIPSNVAFKDNNVDFLNNGIGSLDTPSLDWLPNGIADLKNIINIRFPHASNPTDPGQFPNSFVAANDAAVGYVNVTACDSGADYHGCGLAASSPYHNRASDGTDPGVNLAQLDAALGPLASNLGLAFLRTQIPEWQPAAAILAVSLGAIPQCVLYHRLCIFDAANKRARPE